METHGRRKAAVVVFAALLADWLAIPASLGSTSEAVDVSDPGDGRGVADVVAAHVELLEQGLVDETADFLGCLLVAHLGVVE
ncbi:MAG TPA: hypothetical protein VIH71_15720 [Solirubrobacteraceae bacterium]